MKNAKREVVERLVPFNQGELNFLGRLLHLTSNSLPIDGAGYAARALVERVEEKIGRAQRARYGR